MRNRLFRNKSATKRKVKLWKNIDKNNNVIYLLKGGIIFVFS
jgi:hypothetical protein